MSQIQPHSQTPHAESRTLDQISRGRSVQVVDVVGDDPIARRLNDLGIREGVRIAVIRRAPLGDPTVYELCGYQLCLRRSESSRIRVESEAPPERADSPGTPAPATQTGVA